MRAAFGKKRAKLGQAEPSAAKHEMRVLVVLPSGRALRLTASEKDTVADIKAQVEDATQLGAACQCLLAGGVELSGATTLAAAGIADGGALQLAVRRL
jgi:Ubiquitin family